MTAEVTRAWVCWLCQASGDGTPPTACPGCGAGAEAGWCWQVAEYGSDADEEIEQ